MNKYELDRLIRETFPERKKTAHVTRPSPTPLLTVELLVQHTWGGHRFTFTYTARTISTFEAVLQAKKAAAHAGLEVWMVKDTYEGLPEKETD